MYRYKPGDIMPVNLSKGALKQMEERNIKWEDIDDTMRHSRIEEIDYEQEERTDIIMEARHGLRAIYHQKGRP